MICADGCILLQDKKDRNGKEKEAHEALPTSEDDNEDEESYSPSTYDFDNDDEDNELTGITSASIESEPEESSVPAVPPPPPADPPITTPGFDVNVGRVVPLQNPLPPQPPLGGVINSFSVEDPPSLAPTVGRRLLRGNLEL